MEATRRRANSTQNLRMVLPKMAKWRCISLHVGFTLNRSYSAIIWPLIYKITTFTDVITLYNVCSVHRGIPSVHRGDIMSTSGDIMSTSGGYREYMGVFSTLGGYHEYIGGCSVHWGGTMSTSGGYHEYIRGISWVHRGDTMSTSVDIMSTSGDVRYIGLIPWVHRGDIMSTSRGHIIQGGYIVC